jgi:hypothetical protein
MLRDLAAEDEIAAASERLLRAADARGRLPTPVEDLVEAAGLTPSDELPFDESVLKRAPAHLADAVRRLGLRHKIHAMLDRHERLVYLNPDIQQESRRRFRALHEVGHDILPSQNRPGYADNALTLSWSAHSASERDANQTAAELLFQRELFRQIANGYSIGMAAVIELADLFGASYHAAFRRYTETHQALTAGIVLDHSPCSADPLSFRRREAVCSASWERRFGRPDSWPTVLSAPAFGFVVEAREAAMWQSKTAGELRFPDLGNELRGLSVEAFSNTYRVLVLLWEPRRETLRRRRRLAAERA